MFKNSFSFILNRREEVQKIFWELDYLGRSHLALPINSVNESDWNFTNCKIQRSRAYNHLHLEDVAFGFTHWDQLLQHVFLVKPERSSQVWSIWAQEKLREKIRSTWYQLPFEIPAIDTRPFTLVARSTNDVVVVFLLELDELWNEFWLEQISLKTLTIKICAKFLHDDSDQRP